MESSSGAGTAAKRNACTLDFEEPKKNKQDETMQMQFAEILVQMSCRSFLKFQVAVIISLGTLYCESVVKMKSPMDL